MILTASKILTFQSGAALIDNGAVVFQSGIIMAAGPADKIAGKYPRHRVSHLSKAVLMPGLINLHTHLELPPLPDIVRDRSFTDWIIDLVRAKKRLSVLDYRIAARANINTLIQTGTTTVGEICTHGESPALLRQSGLRAVVFSEIIDMRTMDRGDGPWKPLASHADSVLVKSGLSPHTPYTVSEPCLRAIDQFSKKKGIPLSMHVAETRDELRLFQRKKSGLERLYAAAGWDMALAPKARSSFELLRRIGILGPAFLAVHAVHVDDRDIALIRRSGAGIAHCPRSNHELGVGTMPLRKFLDARISVGLGTDSLASSPTLNLWDEMRYAYQIHRRSGVTPQDIFHMATLGGARALGMDQEIGSLEPGKKADIIAVPLPRKNTGDLYRDVLRETTSCSMSIVNGKTLTREDARFR